MKKLLISAFLLILTVNCFGGCQNQYNVGETTATQLKAEIQTSAEAAVTEEMKTETQSQTEKQIQSLERTVEIPLADGRINVYRYDEKGNLVSAKAAYIPGDTYWYYYEYDESGNKTSEKQTLEDGVTVDDSCTKTEYKYDKNGRIVRESYFEGADTKEKYGNSYEYDENGRLIAEMHRWVGKTESKKVYEYNDAGELVKKSCYDASGNLECKYLYTYNDRKCISVHCVSSNGEENSSFTYEYDSEGNAIKEKYVSENEVLVRIFEYKNGKCIQANNLAADEKTIIAYSEFDYYDNGNMVLESQYSPAEPDYIGQTVCEAKEMTYGFAFEK